MEWVPCADPALYTATPMGPIRCIREESGCVFTNLFGKFFLLWDTDAWNILCIGIGSLRRPSTIHKHLMVPIRCIREDVYSPIYAVNSLYYEILMSGTSYVMEWVLCLNSRFQHKKLRHPPGAWGRETGCVLTSLCGNPFHYIRCFRHQCHIVHSHS